MFAARNILLTSKRGLSRGVQRIDGRTACGNITVAFQLFRDVQYQTVLHGKRQKGGSFGKLRYPRRLESLEKTRSAFAAKTHHSQGHVKLLEERCLRHDRSIFCKSSVDKARF